MARCTRWPPVLHALFPGRVAMGVGTVRSTVPLPSGRHESSAPGTAVTATTSVVTASLSGNICPYVLTAALNYCAIAGDIALATAGTDNIGRMLMIMVCGHSLTGDVYE